MPLSTARICSSNDSDIDDDVMAGSQDMSVFQEQNSSDSDLLDAMLNENARETKGDNGDLLMNKTCNVPQGIEGLINAPLLSSGFEGKKQMPVVGADDSPNSSVIVSGNIMFLGTTGLFCKTDLVTVI